MKIALCLHGLVGSTNSLSYMRDESDTDGKKVCADLSFKDWKRCILDVNDVDVFFHTWDLELEEHLVNLYKPKKYELEKQIIFNVEYYNHLSKLKSIMPEAGRSIVVNYKIFF